MQEASCLVAEIDFLTYSHCTLWNKKRSSYNENIPATTVSPPLSDGKWEFYHYKLRKPDIKSISSQIKLT